MQSKQIDEGGIKIDKYAKVEKKLSRYKMIKINITNMQREIEYLKERDGITGISCEGVGGGNTNEISNVTERSALKNMEDAERMQEKIQRAQLEMDTISRALEGLSETERAIIENKYLEGLQWWEVAYSVGYSERHCKRLRTEAINKLVIGIYGDKAV